MADYTVDIPEDVILNTLKHGCKFMMVRTPDDYTGELDINLRSPLSGRTYDPVNAGIEIVEGYQPVMDALRRIGLRGNNELAELEKLYARSQMPTKDVTRSYMIIRWDELNPSGARPFGVVPPCNFLLSRAEFATLFFQPTRTAALRTGTFLFKTGPLRLVETGNDNRPTGWEINTTMAAAKIWHGTLRKLPEEFALAAGFNNQREAVEMTRNRHGLQGRNTDYDTTITAAIFEPVNAKNITFRPLNDSIIMLNAAPKSGQMERKLQL